MDELLRATARAEHRHFWFRGFRRFVTPLIKQALNGRSDARILDCGCGTGANLALFEPFGAAYGFDLTAVGLYIGRELGRRRLARATVAEVPFRSDTFDLATSFDVLYSLPDADEHRAVAEMYRVVKPGGYALVNVAAMNALKGDYSVLTDELRRYDRPGLRALITGAGFTIERLTYTNMSLFVPLALVRGWQRLRPLPRAKKVDDELGTPPEPVNVIMSGVLFAESLYTRWFDSPFGSSLLCLAKKPVR